MPLPCRGVHHAGMCARHNSAWRDASTEAVMIGGVLKCFLISKASKLKNKALLGRCNKIQSPQCPRRDRFKFAAFLCLISHAPVPSPSPLARPASFVSLRDRGCCPVSLLPCPTDLSPAWLPEPSRVVSSSLQPIVPWACVAAQPDVPKTLRQPPSLSLLCLARLFWSLAVTFTH